jgi:hypothetical protein
MPGVVEHGLFIGIAKMAIVGKESGVVEIRASSVHRGKARKKRTPVKRTVRKKALRKRTR